jgi:hypothetical protein
MTPRFGIYTTALGPYIDFGILVHAGGIVFSGRQ